MADSKLMLYVPTLGDLWFRQTMLADDETMSYNDAWGGTVPFPEEDWGDWYDRWLGCADGKRFYRYLAIAETGEFVGEVAYHYDDDEALWLADVIVHTPYRGHGYGRAGLELLCQAAADNGVDVLYDNIAIDNPAIGLFLTCGFTEDFRTDECIYLRKDLRLDADASAKPIIGRIVRGRIDRPIGSRHPQYPDMVYPVNYGYVEGVFAADGAEQDVYVLGTDEPLETYEGAVIAVYHRLDDVEDKWIVSLDGRDYPDKYILETISFQERFFKGELLR